MTCYHYTNIIKSGLINLIKIGNIFTTENYDEILPAHNTWKVPEKGFKIN